MTSLGVIGPNLTYQPRRLGDIRLARDEIHPLVEVMYSIARATAEQLDASIWFPISSPLPCPTKRWEDVQARLSRFDAVFAVFVGESKAIPAEASLALDLGLPLAIAAIDIDQDVDSKFVKNRIRVVDAKREGKSAISGVIVELFDENAGGIGIRELAPMGV